MPVVVIGDLGNAPLDTVRTDSRQGVRLAYEHLRASGRRRIAFVNGPTDTAPGRARDRGVPGRVGRRHAGPVVEVDDFTVAAGEQAWARLRRPGARSTRCWRPTTCWPSG